MVQNILVDPIITILMKYSILKILKIKNYQKIQNFYFYTISEKSLNQLKQKNKLLMNKRYFYSYFYENILWDFHYFLATFI